MGRGSYIWKSGVCYRNWRYFGTRTHDIVESVLDENIAKVTTGYVTVKLIKRSKCGSCKILLKAGDVDIANDA